MGSERRVYLLYCENRELRARLERVLGDAAVQRVNSREALLAPPMSTSAVVLGLAGCSDGEAEWLRSAFGPLSPPCVVVAHLSVDCLRRLYPLRSGVLQVLWADEAEQCLVKTLSEFRGMSWAPMGRLGLRLLSDHSFRPSVRETISRACGLLTEAGLTAHVPENSVGQMAGHVDLAASTLRQYWREEVPLRCSLKEFLSWAVLLWAVRARSREGWDGIAAQVGLRRRTLERNFLRLAGCGLAAAAADPERVVTRFHEWVDAAWDPHSFNGSRKYEDALVQPASGAQA